MLRIGRHTFAPSFGWAYLVLGLIVAAAAWRAIAHWPRARIEHHTLDVNQQERLFRLVIPKNLSRDEPNPLVVALHGALDDVDDWAPGTRLDQLAVEKRFLLVYPQGWLLNWPPSIPEDNPEVVDRELRFFDAICAHLTKTYRADPTRIYVVGSSQGGGMCNLLVAKRSEQIAAAMCNCGWLPEPLGASALNTRRKTPMLFVVGAEDQQVPPDLVRRARDAFEKDGHPTEFWLVPNHGHGWPREPAFNQKLWQFLSANRNPTSGG